MFALCVFANACSALTFGQETEPGKGAGAVLAFGQKEGVIRVLADGGSGPMCSVDTPKRVLVIAFPGVGDGGSLPDCSPRISSNAGLCQGSGLGYLRPSTTLRIALVLATATRA